MESRGIIYRDIRSKDAPCRIDRRLIYRLRFFIREQSSFPSLKTFPFHVLGDKMSLASQYTLPLHLHDGLFGSPRESQRFIFFEKIPQDRYSKPEACF